MKGSTSFNSRILVLPIYYIQLLFVWSLKKKKDLAETAVSFVHRLELSSMEVRFCVFQKIAEMRGRQRGKEILERGRW